MELTRQIQIFHQRKYVEKHIRNVLQQYKERYGDEPFFFDFQRSAKELWRITLFENDGIELYLVLKDDMLNPVLLIDSYFYMTKKKTSMTRQEIFRFINDLAYDLTCNMFYISLDLHHYKYTIPGLSGTQQQISLPSRLLDIIAKQQQYDRSFYQRSMPGGVIVRGDQIAKFQKKPLTQQQLARFQETYREARRKIHMLSEHVTIRQMSQPFQRTSFQNLFGQDAMDMTVRNFVISKLNRKEYSSLKHLLDIIGVLTRTSKLQIENDELKAFIDNIRVVTRANCVMFLIHPPDRRQPTAQAA